MQQKDIMNVRRAVDANIGRRVRVRANKGRHKYSVAEGVIQESYPSIFTVRINADEDNAERVLHGSLSDNSGGHPASGLYLSRSGHSLSSV